MTRAFGLLEAIGDGPATLTDLARRVDLPISTTSRLLGTLETMGAIERIDDAGLYRIGSSIVKMASSVDASVSLAAITRQDLETLAGQVREACGISVSSGASMHYLSQVDAGRSVMVRDWTGARLPLHLVSSGLVALAHCRPEPLEEYLAGSLEPATDRSVVDPDALRQRLATIRNDGLAWTIDELEVGVSSVSAPVTNGAGELVCVVHVQGPSYRFPDPGSSTDGVARHDAEHALLRAAGRISRRLS